MARWFTDPRSGNLIGVMSRKLVRIIDHGYCRIECQINVGGKEWKKISVERNVIDAQAFCEQYEVPADMPAVEAL